MTLQTKKLDAELAFDPPVGEPVEVHVLEIGAAFEEDTITACQITFEATPEAYAQIDQGSLFNLAQQARGATLGGALDPQRPVKIAAALRQNLVNNLANEAHSIDELAQYVLQLKHHPLTATESWCALNVSQAVPLPPDLADSGNVSIGYSTIWSVEEAMSDEEQPASEQTLFEVLQDFFKSRDWPYEQLDDQTTLHIGYTGENGEWDCFAHVNEENKQASFYSVYPNKTPEDGRSVMTVLLTRINYGMPVGNFEMDLDDGEIRFKTSLDVTDDRLSHALLTQLCEANLYLMDRYFPAIMAVMDDGTAPLKALKLVED